MEHWHHHRRTPDWARHEFARINRRLDEIIELLQGEQQQAPASALISFIDSQGVHHMSDFSFSDSQGPLTATVSFADAKGSTVPPEGAPVWSSSDSSILALDQSQDPSGVTAIVTLGTPGDVSVGVTSTNNDGSAVSASVTVTVTGGSPATASISIG